jgi:hypothetical protein
MNEEIGNGNGALEIGPLDFSAFDFHIEVIIDFLLFLGNWGEVREGSTRDYWGVGRVDRVF